MCNKGFTKNILTTHFVYADFICTDNSHCNGHGSCDKENGQCDCDSDWSSQPDCSGNISIPYFNIVYVIKRRSITMWTKGDS